MFPKMNKGSDGAGEAIVDVVEQSHDDDKSLRRRQGLDSIEKNIGLTFGMELKSIFQLPICCVSEPYLGVAKCGVILV